MHQLLSAQQRLEVYVENASRAFNGAIPQERQLVLDEFSKLTQVNIKTAFSGVLKGGKWPDHLEPLPSIRMALAKMHKELRNGPQALRYALRGCFLSRNRVGPTWVLDLLALLPNLITLGVQTDNEIYTKDSQFPNCIQIRIVAVAYFERLCRDVGLTYGGDHPFSRAIVDWAENFTRDYVKAPSFKSDFEAAQGRLFAWADVSQDAKI